MEGWFQLDWFGSDWNASNWDGAQAAVDSGSVVFSGPAISGAGAVGSSSITGTGTVAPAAPTIDGYALKYSRRGGTKKKKAVDEGLLLLKRWREQEDEAILGVVQSFVHLVEEEEWELSPTA